MRQTEVSRTLVFDAPRRARAFFEALVSDNIGIGRPEEMSLAFARMARSMTQVAASGREAAALVGAVFAAALILRWLQLTWVVTLAHAAGLDRRDAPADRRASADHRVDRCVRRGWCSWAIPPRSRCASRWASSSAGCLASH